jgi:Na+-translocating ferredoxin:NAD+ oxidoreductase RnfC subunit
VGVVVDNVGTLINVAAAQKGISVTKRWLTVHGEVKKPVTIEVPVGTAIRDVIELAGGTKIRDFTMLIGGPMMGAVETSLDAPVTKTTSGVIILSSEHPHMLRKTFNPDGILRRSKASCDQCMYCTELCPRYLIGHNLRPHMMMRALPYGLSDSEIVTTAFLCCECGLCTYYACPLYLSPGIINSIMKKEMGQKNIRNPHRRTELTPFPFRSERKIPTHRLVERLGLAPYDFPAPVVETEFSPEKVRIPLKQHLGAPARPVVREGDRVKAGQLIGEIPEGTLSARVHASISGYVMSVKEDIVIERS